MNIYTNIFQNNNDVKENINISHDDILLFDTDANNNNNNNIQENAFDIRKSDAKSVNVTNYETNVNKAETTIVPNMLTMK